MKGRAFLLLISLFIVIAIFIRLAAGGLVHDRVKQYVESRGGRIIDANSAAFGPGRFGEKSDRIYDVRYVDRDGNEHHAHCKTNLMTGVYFTEDRIVKYAEHVDEQASLEDENRRLREELERLKRQQS